MRVERNGWAENVRVIRTHPESDDLSREVKNDIWYVQFRPRLEDGRAVVAKDVNVHYLVPR